MDTITDDQLRALRAEAAVAGDPEQVALCDAALAGDAAARAACDEAVADAMAQRDLDRHASAAAAFDAAAAPLVGARAKVAEVLGITRGAYGSTLHSARDTSRAAVDWCRRWAEARGERIVLEYDPLHGWSARVLEDL